MINMALEKVKMPLQDGASRSKNFDEVPLSMLVFIGRVKLQFPRDY